MKAVLYVAPVGSFPPMSDQASYLTAWLAEQDHEQVAVVKDEEPVPGVVAAGLLTTIEYVWRGAADCVAVWDLAVVGDVLLQVAYAGEVERAGGVLLTMHETPAPMREYLREYEQQREAFSRMVRGRWLAYTREAKAEAGGRTAGRAPFGWDALGGELRQNAREHAVALRIRDLRRVGMTYQQIADTLSAEGYRTKTGSEVWHREQVRRIVERLDAQDSPPSDASP